MRHVVRSLYDCLLIFALAGAVTTLDGTRTSAASASTDPAALDAIETLAGHFADNIGFEGGYVWETSLDNQGRRGEGDSVEPGEIWIQPPGTPAIGGVYLRLFELTGDPRWRDAARETASVLVRTQLLSGGWNNRATLEAARRPEWCYRADRADAETCKAVENEIGNRSTLDDNITQSALGFLIWYGSVDEDAAPEVRESIDYALSRLRNAQYRNGAWPIHLDRLLASARTVVAWRSSLPASWSREWVKPGGSPVLLLNDHLVRNTIRLMLAAYERYGDETWLAAAQRSGEFLLAAQLPEPQRGWAQAYNMDLQPVWGRSFEPPSVASAETAGSVDALIDLYALTGKERYLEGALQGAKWLESVRRPGGDWARFYELGTDKPLYVDEEGQLSYDDGSLWKSYGMVGEFGIDAVLARAEAARTGARGALAPVPKWDWIFGPHRGPAPEIVLKNVVAAGGNAAALAQDGWLSSSTLVEAVRGYAR